MKNKMGCLLVIVTALAMAPSVSRADDQSQGYPGSVVAVGVAGTAGAMAGGYVAGEAYRAGKITRARLIASGDKKLAKKKMLQDVATWLGAMTSVGSVAFIGHELFNSAQVSDNVAKAQKLESSGRSQPAEQEQRPVISTKAD